MIQVCADTSAVFYVLLRVCLGNVCQEAVPAQRVYSFEPYVSGRPSAVYLQGGHEHTFRARCRYLTPPDGPVRRMATRYVRYRPPCSSAASVPAWCE